MTGPTRSSKRTRSETKQQPNKRCSEMHKLSKALEAELTLCARPIRFEIKADVSSFTRWQAERSEQTGCTWALLRLEAVLICVLQVSLVSLCLCVSCARRPRLGASLNLLTTPSSAGREGPVNPAFPTLHCIPQATRGCGERYCRLTAGAWRPSLEFTLPARPPRLGRPRSSMFESCIPRRYEASTLQCKHVLVHEACSTGCVHFRQVTPCPVMTNFATAICR